MSRLRLPLLFTNTSIGCELMMMIVTLRLLMLVLLVLVSHISTKSYRVAASFPAVVEGL